MFKNIWCRLFGHDFIIKQTTKDGSYIYTRYIPNPLCRRCCEPNPHYEQLIKKFNK